LFFFKGAIMNPSNEPDRLLLRHALATVAYRAGKTLRDAPESFGNFETGQPPRTPARILAHMGDLYDWALSMARGEQKWHNSQPLEWNREVERFFAALKKFDDYLAAPEVVHVPLEKLFQGPVADSLTHVGQIAMLRRLAGCSMKGENYYVAEIAAGRVGLEQAAPRREF
jgi:hypothetical protein